MANPFYDWCFIAPFSFLYLNCGLSFKVSISRPNKTIIHKLCERQYLNFSYLKAHLNVSEQLKTDF